MDSDFLPEFIAIGDLRKWNEIAEKWGIGSCEIVPDEYSEILKAMQDGSFRIIVDANTYYSIADCGRDGPRIWALLSLHRKVG